jgi:L-lactate dehydrogenase
MPTRERIAFIGAGHVGATAAYAMMLRALFREIVLIDSNAALAQAEAADLSDANALARPARIWAGTYEDAASARIAVITAGAATHGSESRLSVASRSAAIVTQCASQLSAAGFEGVLVIASNPVDLMALAAFRCTGFPSARVIGTGTLLDSSRLRQALAARLNVSPGTVDGLVLGEHGDSDVAVFSSVRIGGVALDDFAPDNSKPDQDSVAREVRDAGYTIVTGKGYTSFGVATAIVRICEAVIRDERTVLPASTLLTGQFGISDLYLSMPCLIGAGGVERILLPPLDPTEETAVRASAEALKTALAGLDII